MSIVPDYGIVRIHYQLACQGNVEYKPSAFWQVWLQRAFASEPNIYSVTCESSPDESRRRVDVVVKRYDPSHHTLSAMLWVECKSPKGSAREAENQALDAAMRCIQADNLLWIYVMTTVGVTFRTWFVEKGGKKLVPLHGTEAMADRAQYIDADSADASILQDCIRLIKDQQPLGYAPVLPSQTLDSMPREYGESRMTGEASNPPLPPDSWGYDPDADRPPLQQYEGEYEPESMQEDASYPAEVSTSNMAAPGTQSSDKWEKWLQVTVTVIHHVTKRDEYTFQDANGRTRVTDRNEWERAKYKGDKVWAWHGKRTTFFTQQISKERHSFSLK